MRKSVWMSMLLALTAGCPTVDLGDDPPDPGQCRPSPVYYETVIWPQFLAPADVQKSCVGQAACHRREDGRSALRLAVAPPDQPDLVDHADNYTVVTRFLNCGTPEASSLLTKPLSGVDPHGGGDLIDENDTALIDGVFQQWFLQP